MEQILDSPVSSGRNFTYAGFWIRVAAYLIDAIILWIVQLILAFALFGGYNFTEPNISLSLISLIVNVIYFGAMESSGRQATLGKSAVGIKVGDANGDKISFANAMGRHFAKILSGLLLLIGFMMVGWDAKKQGLHDKLANTYVFYA